MFNLIDEFGRLAGAVTEKPLGDISWRVPTPKTRFCAFEVISTPHLAVRWGRIANLDLRKLVRR